MLRLPKSCKIYARAETYETLTTVLSVEPKTASGGGKNRDDVIRELCNEILGKVDIEKISVGPRYVRYSRILRQIP